MTSLLPRLRLLLLGLLSALISLPAQADTFEISGTSWLYDGTEFPSMCITFEPNGTLRFKGGFLYYNPSRWSKVEGGPELVRIHLGGKVAFPRAVAERQLKREPNGSLVSFDAKERLLVYRIGFGNVPIEFNGFIFAHEANCANA